MRCPDTYSLTQWSRLSLWTPCVGSSLCSSNRRCGLTGVVSRWLYTLSTIPLAWRHTCHPNRGSINELSRVLMLPELCEQTLAVALSRFYLHVCFLVGILYGVCGSLYEGNAEVTFLPMRDASWDSSRKGPETFVNAGFVVNIYTFLICLRCEKGHEVRWKFVQAWISCLFSWDPSNLLPGQGIGSFT